MWRLLEGRYLLEGGAYFNVGTQKCGAYKRAVLIIEALLIRGNTGIPKFLDSGRKSWTLVSGRWTLDAGLWTLDSGR